MRNELLRLSALALALALAPAARADLLDDEDETPAQPSPAPSTAPTAPQHQPASPVPKAGETPPAGSGKAGPKPKSLPDDEPEEPAAPPRPAKGSSSVLAPKGGNPKKKDSAKAAKEPVHFESRGAKGLREKGIFELEKDVVVTQGTMRMEADHATVYGNEKAKDVLKVVADGNVKIFMVDEDSGEKVKAFGNQVVFDNKARTVVLEGNARLWRGADLVRGKKITYEMDTGWIRADRVAGEVHPDSAKGGGGGGAP